MVTLLLAAGGFLSQLVDFLCSCGSCKHTDRDDDLYVPLNAKN
jgi:hypothetical protein